MLQLRQLLEQAVGFDLIQLIVGQQSGRKDKESQGDEKVRVYRQRLIRGAINRATGRRSIKRVRIIYFE